jgi:hypothetical protein
LGSSLGLSFEQELESTCGLSDYVIWIVAQFRNFLLVLSLTTVLVQAIFIASHEQTNFAAKGNLH